MLNPWFLVPFMGTAAACALLIVSALVRWDEAESIYLLGGGGLYLVGTLAAMVTANVPRNDALAAVEAGSVEGAARWARFVPAWTAWNTGRPVASLAAAALTLALVAG